MLVVAVDESQVRCRWPSKSFCVTLLEKQTKCVVQESLAAFTWTIHNIYRQGMCQSHMSYFVNSFFYSHTLVCVITDKRVSTNSRSCL